MTTAPLSALELARYFDHTLLKPEATAADIQRLCAEAAGRRFYAVCVNPYWAAAAATALRGTDVNVCCVVGFPLGAVRSSVKAAEAAAAIDDGAAEVDMVLNIGRMLEGNAAAVAEDIALVRRAAGSAVLKVIIETRALPEAVRAEAAAIVRDSGADFVKTSTGFHAAGGATVADVALLSRVAGGRIGVKASGGIRDLATTLAMIDAGATRIGASAGMTILDELARRSS